MADFSVSSGMGAVGDLAGMAATNPQNVCGNSMEQIFSPVQVVRNSGGGGAGSGFEQVQFTPDANGTNQGGHVGPTRGELDPYFSNLLNSTWIEDCDYAIMRNNGSATVGGGEDINIRKTTGQISNIMATGLRGPLILSGWGYDVADRPVPGGLDGLDDDVPGNRGGWKSGPVDLKWDDERKVWSGGAHIICGVAAGKIQAPTDPCQPTYFQMKVFRLPGGGTFGSLTACVLGETVWVANRDPSLTEPDTQGRTFVVCVRLNYEWVPIWVGCPDPTGLSTPACVQC